MARSFTRASALYEPGTYGPYLVDGLTRNNTRYLRWSLTVEDWPTDSAILLFTLRMRWNNGYSAGWPIHGGRRDREGNLLTKLTDDMHIPPPNPQNVAVTSGTLTIVLNVPLRTAIDFRSVS